LTTATVTIARTQYCDCSGSSLSRSYALPERLSVATASPLDKHNSSRCLHTHSDVAYGKKAMDATVVLALMPEAAIVLAAVITWSAKH
jgi:hypothetical protein